MIGASTVLPNMQPPSFSLLIILRFLVIKRWHVMMLFGLLHQILKVVLVGHNWGWMVGAEIARRRPKLFSKLIILNTNNLPDGEALLER